MSNMFASVQNKVSSFYQSTIIKRPFAVLAGLFALTVLAIIGLPNFKLDASADSLTLEHDTTIDYFREINQRYQRGDFLVVTYSPKADMFSDESINTLKSLRDDLAKVEGVQSVNSMIDVPLIYSPMRSLAEQKESTRTLLTPDIDRAQAKQEFLSSPIYRNMLLSPDGKTTALLINLDVNNHAIELVRKRDALRAKRDAESLTPAEQEELKQVAAEYLVLRTEAAATDSARVEVVRQIAQKYRDHAEIFLGGVTMITSDMLTYIKSDLVVFGAVLVAFIILVLAVIFRQWRFIILPLGTCLISVALMLGWLSWIDWRLTVISSNFVALLLIMAFAFTIYVVVRYREIHAQHPDWEQADLVMATARAMVEPCLFSALTTIVAFMSLVMSGIRPVIDFGWMMTIGLTVAFILSFVVVPAGLMLLPKGEPKDSGDKSAKLTLPFSRIAEFHGGTVIAVTVLLSLVSIWGLSKLEVENRFIDYFHSDSEIYRGLSVIDKQLGGTATLEIIIDAPKVAASEAPVAGEAEEDPFAEPAAKPQADAAESDDPFADVSSAGETKPKVNSYWFSVSGLDQIKQLHDYLESLPEVGKVQSLAISYQVAQDINGGKLNDFELGVMRSALSKDIQNILIAPYLSDEKQQARITLRVKETTPNLRRAELVERIRHYAIDEAKLQPEQVHFTGMLTLYNNMLASLFESQIKTIFVVFISIVLMMLLLFRSLSIALIAIFPNILAAGIVLGGMGLAKIPMDMMTTTIAAIVVGVGVDQAIQYIYRFKEEFAQCGNYIESMHRSHASIGRAMFYSSATIVIGFSILALSQFIPSIYFGVLTSFAMFTAIIGTLTLLPKLILMFKPLGAEKV
ncbi:membrane protein [Cellvibrio zantedeschiae]|uniref:Membrane protein n=1 Tax=Cellvibrio zantedeschiae TaxID=1237077 RepID=A0ABQ3B696_9GAMM|nr:MMPL family transporter [Cellvibrio zantedeschiae]GGY80252.1 membrane protein [Cellvibrio zantedeschiae]